MTGLDELLTRTQRALAAVRAGGQSGDEQDDEPLHGEGIAADGLVRAAVVQGGRLESITADPRLARQGIEQLCEHIVVAVNAAFADLRTQTAAATPDLKNTAALGVELGDLQNQSVRQMAVFTAAMNDVVAKLNGGR